jgi:hypothetical protein
VFFGVERSWPSTAKPSAFAWLRPSPRSSSGAGRTSYPDPPVSTPDGHTLRFGQKTNEPATQGERSSAH